LKSYVRPLCDLNARLNISWFHRFTYNFVYEDFVVMNIIVHLTLSNNLRKHPLYIENWPSKGTSALRIKVDNQTTMHKKYSINIYILASFMLLFHYKKFEGTKRVQRNQK